MYYDEVKDSCFPFRYKGEGGNANRFIIEKQCMRNCSDRAEELYPRDGNISHISFWIKPIFIYWHLWLNKTLPPCGILFYFLQNAKLACFQKKQGNVSVTICGITTVLNITHASLSTGAGVWETETGSSLLTGAMPRVSMLLVLCYHIKLIKGILLRDLYAKKQKKTNKTQT